MKAIALQRYLPPELPESLFDAQLPMPSPGPHDILVRVEAAAINPLDNRVRRPKDKVEEQPRVLGWDASGVVLSVGSAVTKFRPGESVYYAGEIGRQGSFAEFQLVNERLAAHKPESLDHAEAAALPLTALTAWSALFARMKVPRDPLANAGKSILIIGAAGGVGSMAVQFAARVAGLAVIATASRPDSADWVRALGATHVIDHRGDIPAQMAQAGFRHADYVLILSDTDTYYPAAVEAVAPEGTIGTVVEATKPIDWGALWDKSATLVWEMVFTRNEYTPERSHLIGEMLAEVAKLAEAGVIRSTMTEHITPLNAGTLHAALQRMAGGRSIGKTVLSGFAP
jgi:zinc-binding alcohol dehydrogenase family protein